MKKIFFTCGPSQIYHTYKNHLNEALAKNIPSISHRSYQFQQIYHNTVLNLKKLLNIPEDYYIFFLGSSLESMERIIENCVIKNTFHFVNGSFSRKFYEISENLKKSPKKIEVEDGLGFDFMSVKIPKNTELICITQNETSTGVAIDPIEINFLKNRYPKMLLAVDIVSSAPYPKLDFNKIDLAFFSVQKNFGLPSGLSVVIVSKKAVEKAKFMKSKGYNIGSFHNFISLEKYHNINQTPETPNVLNIFLLGKIASDMNKYGINKIRKETNLKAKIIYDYFDNHSLYQPFVKEKKWRSKTTIVININSRLNYLLKKLKSKGFFVSQGYGKFKNSQIRIANFPAHKTNDIKKLLLTFDKIN